MGRLLASWGAWPLAPPPKSAYEVIYKSVVLTKLLYATSAWWGFATSADKQRLQAFLRRGVRLNLYSALDPSVCVEDTDDELFSAVMSKSHHVLHHMLIHEKWPGL